MTLFVLAMTRSSKTVVPGVGTFNKFVANFIGHNHGRRVDFGNRKGTGKWRVVENQYVVIVDFVI